jgi:hypothetical protein
MIAPMKWQRFIATCMMIFSLSFSSTARAAGLEDEEPPLNDGRTEGYNQKVQIPKPSTALVWLAFMALTVVSMGVMFKDARRTHLD